MDIYTIQEEAYKRGYEAGVKSVTDKNVGGKMTPTDREELYNLIHTFVFEGAEVSDMNLADYLIANGVTIPVRCKDCKWRNTRACPYMLFNAVARTDKDYCSDGERKDNG